MKRANQILKWIIFAAGIVFDILHFVDPERYPKLISYIATSLIPFVPDLIRALKVKVSDELELAYLLFIIPAMVVGIDMDLYKVPWHYDKIVHGASGVLVAFVAKEFADQNKLTKRNWFYILYILGIVALTAVAWECFEFSYDLIAGGHMQELVSTGVDDTMWDLIVAIVGGGLVAAGLVFCKKK